MIKKDKILTIVQADDMPVDLMRASDVVLSHYCTHDQAILNITNPGSYVLEFGKSTRTSNFNMEKLKEDGIRVLRRMYGGSASFGGPEDLLYAFYIDKGIFEGDPTAKDIYLYFNKIITEVLEDLGLTVRIDDSIPSRKGNVCIGLSGRCETVTDDDVKVHVSVFKEDEIFFYMTGHFILSNTWAKIYDYINAPEINILTNPSISDILNRKVGVKEVENQLIKRTSDHFSYAFKRGFTERELEIMQRIKDRYVVL